MALPTYDDLTFGQLVAGYKGLIQLSKLIGLSLQLVPYSIKKVVLEKSYRALNSSMAGIDWSKIAQEQIYFPISNELRSSAAGSIEAMRQWAESLHNEVQLSIPSTTDKEKRAKSILSQATPMYKKENLYVDNSDKFIESLVKALSAFLGGALKGVLIIGGVGLALYLGYRLIKKV